MNDFQRYFDYKDKVVLVTGGSGGLGAEISMQYALLGANIILNYRSDFARAQAHAKKLKELSVGVAVIKADLKNEDEVKNMTEQAVREFGKIDVLINNAGVYPLKSILDMRSSDWDSVLEANLKSAVLSTKFVAQTMIKTKTKGAIINISSIEAEQAAKNHSHYASSKAALNMFTKASANELAEHNIRVNSVSPGLIAREGLENDWPDGVKRWLQACPLKTLITTKQIANACIFLTSDAAATITGVDIKIDGGIATNSYF